MRQGIALVAAALVAVAGCGGGTGAAGGPTDEPTDDVCRPPLDEEAPHPIGGSGGPHPALADGEWFAPIAEQLATGQVDGTAGLWLDQDAGEVVVMITADDASSVLAQLRVEVDAEHAERITCMRAEHTMAELEDLQQEVTERLADLGAYSSGIDTVRNRVEVSHESDPAAVAERLGDLVDHPALQVSRPDCADVVAPPTDAIMLPGDGSTCSGMDALLTGTLVGDPETGCLFVEAESDQRVAIAWPRGWWLMPDGTVHDHRGVQRARIGETVNAGGGHVPDAAGTLPEVCRADGDAFLLSSLDPA